MSTSPTARFRVYGDPKPQPRPRAFARKMPDGSHRARVHDPSTAEGWKSQIAEAARLHLPATPLDGPITLNVTFLLARPKRLLRKRDPVHRISHTSKPDLDNLLKAVKDALTTLGMWRDDSLVCQEITAKWYVATYNNERPGAEIAVFASEAITLADLEQTNEP